MQKTEAEESLRLIREVMERSARYTNFSGLSGIIAGTLALIGCAATLSLAYRGLYEPYIGWYVAIWVGVFVVSIAQDFYLAQRKARKMGQRFLTPATLQIVKAVLPGVFVGLVISLVCLHQGSIDAIPAVWALGHGTALCAAGMFTVREVRIFGALQLLTGAVGLVWLSGPISSFYLLGVSMGLYHIGFGLWMSRKYGW
ncbi:MAG: hypothetical protein M1133_08105 [Armatimonadetes bacterium]|nr:hypothetical protein [Armatimonadota bacterium]